MRSFASVALAGLGTTAPALAQNYDCTLSHHCIATECSDAPIQLPLTIHDDRVLLGPTGDALVLRALPLETPSRRAFVSDEGNDVFFATLGENLDFVMTSHLANTAFRYAVSTGQCQEAR